MALLVDKLHPLVLNVGLAVHNADWNWKNVNSPFTRLYYITEGTAQIQLSGGIQILKPNYLYFIPAFTIHSYICNSYFCHYYLHIYEEHQLDTNLLDEWEFPVEIPAGDLDLALFQRLCAINPHMSLPKSDPSTYDNNSTLMENLLKNKLMLGVFLLVLILQGIITQFGAAVFETVPLSAAMWGKMLLTAFTVIILNEGIKAVKRLFVRK